LYLTKEGLASISEKLNPFWRDILLNLSELLTIKDEEEKDIINILSQQPLFLSTISYLPHIFLYNLEVTFSMGTYSSDQEVYEATTFLVLYRKIQYVSMLTPLLHSYL
jgi:hypothetical protein